MIKDPESRSRFSVRAIIRVHAARGDRSLRPLEAMVYSTHLGNNRQQEELLFWATERVVRGPSGRSHWGRIFWLTSGWVRRRDCLEGLHRYRSGPIYLDVTRSQRMIYPEILRYFYVGAAKVYG